MSDTITIADQTVVSFHYTLTDGDGQKLDSSEGQPPLTYLHGAGNIVPGLEKALVGLAEGAETQVSVPPEEGYGVRNEDAVRTLPAEAFGDFTPEPGMRLATRDAMGSVLPMWVKEVGEDGVKVDFNHPLAGVTLNFAVQIVSVRKATEAELSGGCGGGGCGGCGSGGGCGSHGSHEEHGCGGGGCC